jgi:NAD(P)-dependent dehydrogenase (short-subunit alcohol dehydrogenase family)
MDTDLSGRTALITGGSLGLGLATATAFHAAGARVAIVARRAEPIEAACASVMASGAAPDCADIRGYVCDVTDADGVAAMVERVSAELGDVDILVNNAGQSAAKPFAEISDEEWQADIDLKLFAAIRLSRLVWGHMESQGWGRIINLLNVYAKMPDARTAPTSVTRAAGMALTKVLAGEGAPHNILVNAMLIGFIKSDQIRRRFEAADTDQSFDEFVQAAGARLPMGRMGEAEEVANLALFLASEAGSYVTGCAINMDGGVSKVP